MDAEPEPTLAHPDWDELNPTRLTRFSSLSVMSLGVYVAFLGVQLISSIEGFGFRSAFMLAFGALALAIGGQVPKLRFWSAIAGIGLGVFVILFGFILFFELFSKGVFSALALAVPAHGMLTATLCAFALGSVQRADAARRRLREDGFEV